MPHGQPLCGHRGRDVCAFIYTISDHRRLRGQVTSMYQQSPHRVQRCLLDETNPQGAHASPVAMVAPGSGASYFEVVVVEPRKSSRNGGKLVADAHHNHDTVLSRGHAGRRVNSAYAPGAHGNALGRTTGSSPLRSEQDGILCISSGVLRFWFLGVYASTPQALKLHKKRIQVVHRTCNAEDAIEFETEW